jgi:hypothetical protein
MTWSPTAVRVLVGVTALVLAFAPRAAQAQCDSCRILRTADNGSVSLEIGGRRYLALTESQQRDMLATEERARRAERLVTLKDSLLASSQALLAEFDSTLAQQRRYTGIVDSLYRGYRDLAAGYRRLGGDARVSFRAAAGFTWPDTEPAVLLGLNAWRVDLWWFVQKSNSGVMLGTNWKLF